MDLTKLSINDRLAVESGDLSKVSVPGIKIMMGQTAAANQRTAKDDAKYGPMADMSGFDQFAAATGKAVGDLGSGIKQQLIDPTAVALERTFGGERVSRSLGMPTAVAARKSASLKLDAP